MSLSGRYLLRNCTTAGLRPLRAGVGGVLVAFGFLQASLAGAGPNPTSASAAPSKAADDCRLTTEARQIIADDVELSTFNVGVSVSNNVITTWGAAPSRDAARRLEAKLRRVPGVARVVNQLSIEAPGDPLVEFLNLPPRPLTPKAAPGIRAAQTVEAEADKTSRTAFGPARSSWPGPAPALTSRIAPAPPAVEKGIIGTMPAIALPQRSTVPGEGSLSAAIADLQRGNDRLRGVQADVRGSVVRLRGVPYTSQDLFVLARAISQLPGVERVVIEPFQAIRH